MFDSEKAKNPSLSVSIFAEQVGIVKSMLSRWLVEKNDIFQKSSDLKSQHLKKGRESKKHVYKVHEKKDHICQSCGKVYKDLKYLQNHILSVHEGKNEYKCEVCGYGTNLSERLEQHIHDVHEKKKDFVCDSCGYSASQLGTLNRHYKKQHSKIKLEETFQ